jgi:glycosyltransferase involved in cell wall biosynthesis
MFTAIIPTLWKSPRITQLITDLCACEFVGEVIVIDNNPSEEKPYQQHEKLAIHMMFENTYVNPSWNYGAEHAKYDNLLICNDDINFNPSFLEIYDDSLQHTGIIGMDFSNYQLKADHNIHLKPMQARPYGWGCLMLIHKSKYTPIPDDLLIANGDDWLAQHATPFVLHGLAVQSEISTTSRLEEFGMIQLRDNETYKTKYAKTNTN